MKLLWDAAERAYEQAVFGGDLEAVATGERMLESAEADLLLARGKLLHARFLLSGPEQTDPDPA